MILKINKVYANFLRIKVLIRNKIHLCTQFITVLYTKFMHLKIKLLNLVQKT